MSRQFGHQWNIDPQIELVLSATAPIEFTAQAASFFFRSALFPIPIVNMAAQDKFGLCEIWHFVHKKCASSARENFLLSELQII